MFHYYEVEDRWYRCRPNDLMTMEIWSPSLGLWTPYQGDPVSVWGEGSFSTTPPDILPVDSTRTPWQTS